VTACAVLPDSRRALSASFNGSLILWDMKTGRTLATYGRGAFHSVATDGEVICAGDSSGKVWILEGDSSSASGGFS
jgi:WD40 repeat protein